MDTMRKPFQGVWNIIRFNWQFYVLAIISIVVLFLLRNHFNAVLRAACDILVVVIIGSTLISSVVSWYIYDFSDLYKLSWLDNLAIKGNGKIANINAGFDETSILIKSKFANSELLVFDFYDPAKHTEVSIKRARKAYSPFPNTQQVRTNHLPLQDNSTNTVFAILSAHEIRNDDERNLFFKELHRVLTATGQIIVTEHLRDTANLLAYNIGFFHFHSRTTWLNTFHNAGLRVTGEIKITPFITTFILDKNGTAS
jgi:ubiquinone/menaquinone biosynthesis C-methylase UbiE